MTSTSGNIYVSNIYAPNSAVTLNSQQQILSTNDKLTQLNDINAAANIVAASLSLSAQKIGKDASESIVVEVADNITLKDSQNFIYLVNLNNSDVNNESLGQLIDILRDRNRTTELANNHNRDAFLTELTYEDLFIVDVSEYQILTPTLNWKHNQLSGNYRLSSFVPQVPTLIQTKQGWRFHHANFTNENTDQSDDNEVSHIRKRQINDKDHRVEWYLDGFKYKTPSL